MGFRGEGLGDFGVAVVVDTVGPVGSQYRAKWAFFLPGFWETLVCFQAFATSKT